MFINLARLFHDFQNVEWFVQCSIICSYDVECILTTLNDLYYVEWFVLTWVNCTCNAECVLTMLKDLHCCWMIWTVQWNLPLETSPGKLPGNFLYHENHNNEHCPIKNPTYGYCSSKNCFATNEEKMFKVKKNENKGQWHSYFTKIYIRVIFDHRNSLACRLFRPQDDLKNKNVKILKTLRRASQNNYLDMVNTVITQLAQGNRGTFLEGPLKILTSGTYRGLSRDSQGTNTKIYGLWFIDKVV